MWTHLGRAVTPQTNFLNNQKARKLAEYIVFSIDVAIQCGNFRKPTAVQFPVESVIYLLSLVLSLRAR